MLSLWQESYVAQSSMLRELSTYEITMMLVYAAMILSFEYA